MGYVLLILLCFLFALVVSVLCLIWPVSLLYSFMIAFGFLCTVASVSALFIGFLCTVASVSALFIHDCLWFSLYCGQCLCFVHSWLSLVFSVLWPVSLLCSFMIAFGFVQRVCQWDDDDVCFVLDQHTWYDFYTACSLKPQSKGRHVTTIGHIILIPSQPVFALTPQCCTLRGEGTNINFKGLWFDLTALRDKQWPLHHWCSLLFLFHT